MLKSNGKEVLKDNLKSKSRMKKIVAFILLLVVTLFVVSELVTYTTWAIPAIAIQLFRVTGIGIHDGLTFAEFSVGDFAVMFMMWILPCLFVLGLSVYVHVKLIKWYFKRFFGWLSIIFAKNIDK